MTAIKKQYFLPVVSLLLGFGVFATIDCNRWLFTIGSSFFTNVNILFYCIIIFVFMLTQLSVAIIELSYAKSIFENDKNINYFVIAFVCFYNFIYLILLNKLLIFAFLSATIVSSFKLYVFIKLKTKYQANEKANKE